MYSRDVETYMSYCDRKGLAQRTLHSYDQTLRMFGMYLETIGIKNTEDIRHVDISNYLDSLVRRGKYTICTVKNQTQPNYPENRKDLGKPISACCINNYLRNMNAFFNWCIKLNGTSQGAWDGSSTKTINITAASVGATNVTLRRW